ncbi:uncharacterized protein LOC143882325 [Tasmannia lanceolata]|uniref:uncharacterized protein LOC143882325 n=1 Tax=Tasmannia lanceolata TaxID=3420 RepID=UPI00406341A4
MQTQSKLEKVRQGDFVRAQGRQGQKRKVPEISSPAPTQDALPSRGKPSVKLVGAYGRGAGSSKSGEASIGVRPAQAKSGDNVFWPNWAVQKSDTGLGESQVAMKIVTKGLPNQDKLQVLNEPPAAVDKAIFSSLYQIRLYYSDFREKSRKFAEAITKSEEKNGQLMQEATELHRSISERDVEIQRLKADMAAQKQKAAEALNAQRERARERQTAAVEEAVQKKEDELISLSTESYKLGFMDCLEQVKGSNSAVVLTGLVLPDPPVVGDDEQGTTTAAEVQGAHPSRDGDH